jgi:hypothetical protein
MKYIWMAARRTVNRSARAANPSGQVLAALARALRLTNDERDHLRTVAGQAPPKRTAISPHVTLSVPRLDRPPEPASRKEPPDPTHPPRIVGAHANALRQIGLLEIGRPGGRSPC